MQALGCLPRQAAKSFVSRARLQVVMVMLSGAWTLSRLRLSYAANWVMGPEKAAYRGGC
jgi:hypothetical protein